jgi:hypothetical protein
VSNSRSHRRRLKRVVPEALISVTLLLNERPIEDLVTDHPLMDDPESQAAYSTDAVSNTTIMVTGGVSFGGTDPEKPESITIDLVPGRRLRDLPELSADERLLRRLCIFDRHAGPISRENPKRVLLIEAQDSIEEQWVKDHFQFTLPIYEQWEEYALGDMEPTVRKHLTL